MWCVQWYYSRWHVQVSGVKLIVNTSKTPLNHPASKLERVYIKLGYLECSDITINHTTSVHIDAFGRRLSSAESQRCHWKSRKIRQRVIDITQVQTTSIYTSSDSHAHTSDVKIFQNVNYLCTGFPQNSRK